VFFYKISNIFWFETNKRCVPVMFCLALVMVKCYTLQFISYMCLVNGDTLAYWYLVNGLVLSLFMYPYKAAVIFSNCIQNWNCWQISVKVSNLNSTNIGVTGIKLFHMDRQTDGWTYAMKLIVFCFPSALRTCQTVEGTDRHTDCYTCLSNNAVQNYLYCCTMHFEDSLHITHQRMH